MGQFYTEIPESLISWIRQQKLFWVATAPLTGSGHVNVSPKGVDGTFNLVHKNKVWYEDLTGSGKHILLWHLLHPLKYPKGVKRSLTCEKMAESLFSFVPSKAHQGLCDFSGQVWLLTSAFETVH